jgi:rhodanese-related sulfurtransferase
MKKLKGLTVMLLVSLSLFGLTACKSEGDNTPTYEQITAATAKEIMDTETDYIIIDARTEEEFAEGHIKDAILIPEYEIRERAEKELPDKDTLILVYCRSGRRSKIASDELARLGYTNVKEFGGIIDWPYETVK